MKLLFANAERDLLSCYSVLLKTKDREVLTAFDGPQLYSQLAGCVDLVISDAALPRLDAPELIRHLKNESTGILLLLNDKRQKSLFTDLLPEESLLFYPFSPEELENKIRGIMKDSIEKAVTS